MAKDDSEMRAIRKGSSTTYRRGKQCLILEFFKDSKKVDMKTAKEITEKEAKGLKVLGQAVGQDFFHCLYLAGKYCKNFDERVVAYSFGKPKDKRFQMAVTFYKK